MIAEPARLEVWSVALDALDPPAGDELGALFLSAPAVLQAAARDALTSPDVRARRLAWARFALRILLARHVGSRAVAAGFVHAPFGKPRLAHSAAPDFSLSHSQAVALVAICRDGDVGVDVEGPRSLRMPLDRRARIVEAATALARAHSGALSSDLRAPDDAAVLCAWVRLEAAAKASGEGMGRLLTRLGIAGTDADRSALAAHPDPHPRLTVHDLPLSAPYVGALATSRPGPAPNVRPFARRAADVARLLAELPD